MPEEKKGKKIDTVKETPPPAPPAQAAPPPPPPPAQNPAPKGAPSGGMSSGAKWGIGIGACFCCLLVVVIVFLILGFAGCSMIRGFGGYNWPAAPPLDNGTEIPVPSFSNTPTPSK
jgi:predicted lipid-binding transport protein (Tim44 family)